MNTRIIFAFGVDGYRDEYYNNYHPVTLYEKGAENPYHHDPDTAEEMIDKAFDTLPKEPEEYTRSDAGLGGWVRFDYDALLSGENQEPILCDDKDLL